MAASLYAFWRAGRMSDRASALQDLSDFLDTMIKTDHRIPVWLWPDGRLQADGTALSLAGFAENISRLDDMISDTGDGLPQETVELIKAGVSQGVDVPTPLVVDNGPSNARMIIDLQWLPSRDARWPSGIMWLEQSMDRPTRTNLSGVRAVESRLRDLTAVFNHLPFPVWVRSADFRLLEVNDAYVSATDGGTSATVIENNLELFGNAGPASASKAYEQSAPLRERRFGVIDGQRRAFNVTNTPLDRDGNTMGIAIDVTGEEEALAELSRVLDSQSETLNRLRSPVAIFGPGQTLRFYNNAFTRLTNIAEEQLASGIRHGELLDGMHERRRLPEQADFRRWKEGILKQYTTLLEPFEEMWHLPDGATHRVVTQPHPLGGLLILFEDVTDKLALERSYNTLIAVQQETLDNMRESIAVFGTDGRLQLSNPAFNHIWQLDEKAVNGSPHLTDLIAMAAPLSTQVSGETDFSRELVAWIASRNYKTGKWYRGDGYVIDYTIVPLPDGGVMLTQTDVTDTHKVEKALRERSEALEAADRLKSEFITNMSYELRTPLNSIIGFSEMLDQQIFGSLNEQQHGYIKNILSASSDLKNMISDVLDLAVIQSGEVALEYKKNAVAATLKEASILAQGLALRASTQLILKCDDSVGEIEADGPRLKQAFFNMVSSMLRFTRQGGKLTINLEDAGEEVHVWITNPESGLSVKERARLLETVSLGASPGMRRARGLDLALVRSIISLHQGRVSLEPFSSVGLGLSCYLPRTQNPPL
jgi:signal transduction histidine kinase